MSGGDSSLLDRSAQGGAGAWLRTLAQPFRPPIETARHYSLFKLRKDLIAGLTVAVVEVPQAMAYAIIAGVPPVYGLYTSILQGVLGALLSSSEHMTTGPTNTQSLLIASALHRVVSPEAEPQRYLELVFCLTLLKGLIQLAFAAARMGNMVRYISRSVITGLVAGAGLLIFFGQLPAFLGIAGRSDDRWPGIIGPIARLIDHIDEINPRAVGIGLAALTLILVVRAINRFLPSSLLGIVAGGGIVALAGWGRAEIPLIQSLPPSFPHLYVPQLTWGLVEQLFGGALALAVIGLLESVAIAKSIAAHSGEDIHPNQEFLAQGTGNFISSVFLCIPGSGSFARSALDYEAGAQTRFAAVFNAMFVAGIFLLFGSLAGYVPRAALAAVLFVIAYGLIDWRYFARLARTSRTDWIVCIVTFAATLIAPLEYAIFIGIFLNIALYLRQASQLHLAEMIQPPTGGAFIETPIHDRSGHKQVMFLQVEGDLFFGVADELRDRLNHLAQSGVRVVILRLKRTHSIDTTVLHVLEGFGRNMRERNGYVILCGLRPELMRTIKNYGLLDLLGKENVFETRGGIFESAKQALRRARQLTAASIDTQKLEDEMKTEAITYEI
jgi:SulP family sulfate permease